MTRGKVLIVEDSKENVVFLSEDVLEPLGYKVIFALDGETGLQKAIEEEPDILITDLKVPRREGLSILEELKARGVCIPSILMTFHGSEDTAVQAFRLGVQDYLIKPFTVEQMRQALGRAERARASLREEPVDTREWEQIAIRWEAEANRQTTIVAQREEALRLSERRVAILLKALEKEHQEIKKAQLSVEQTAKELRTLVEATESMLEELKLKRPDHR